MNRLKPTVCVLIGLVFSGCQMTDQGDVFQKPSPEVSSVMGQPPRDAKQQIHVYLKTILKDPESIKSFNVDKPAQGKRFIPVLEGGPKHVDAWFTCFSYNARNSYGGYVGAKTYVAFFDNGKLVNVADLDNPWPKHNCR